MIVRLMNDGQYQVPDALQADLNAADDRAGAALADGDLAALNASIQEIRDLVRANGERLRDDELSPSDAIVPPADLTLDEADELLNGEGLIPDLPG